MKNRQFPAAGQRGFSLLEILVAFSILAISLTVLVKIFSSGVYSAAVSREYTDAVQIAESLMASTGVATELQEGVAQGTVNEKYHWEVMVSSYQPEQEETDFSVFPVNPFHVMVKVGWGEDGSNPRSVYLETLKLAVRNQ